MGVYKGGFDGMMAQRRVMMKYGGYSQSKKKRSYFRSMVVPMLCSGEYSIPDLIGVAKGYRYVLTAILGSLLALFGTGGSDKLTDAESYELGPTRLSFWDCDLKDEWISRVEEANELPTEAKSENAIDRISGVARNPRYTERVIAGALFDFRLTVKGIDDEEKTLLPTVLAGLKLLELDSLGGSGSRGYGKIALEGLTIDGQDRQAEFAKLDPFKTQTK